MQIERYNPKSANKKMTVIISPNIKKESARIDPAGNIIDARTKQILKPVTEAYVPPTVTTPTEPVVAPVAPPVAPQVEMSVLDQINQAKKNLKDLEELKKIKIAEKKAELKLLEQ